MPIHFYVISSDMTEEDRYFSRVDDYDLLLSAALRNCDLVSVSEVRSDRQSYASIVHDKIVAHVVVDQRELY